MSIDGLIGPLDTYDDETDGSIGGLYGSFRR